MNFCSKDGALKVGDSGRDTLWCLALNICHTAEGHSMSFLFSRYHFVTEQGTLREWYRLGELQVPSLAWLILS